MVLPARVVEACTPAPNAIAIASFNVKWIGYYENERRNEQLAAMVADCDIVVVQELVAPPDFDVVGMPVGWPSDQGKHYPNGKALKPDKGATDFFRAFLKNQSRYVLSNSDTGSSPKVHVNSASTEWFVAFYKHDRVCTTGDNRCGALPKSEFLARDISDHPDFERVPYAFAFRALNDGDPANDFVLVSVHLQPNKSTAAKNRRRNELAAIMRWAEDPERLPETDIVVLGDMNIHSCEELGEVLPSGYLSLNDECRDTVPSKHSRPYDNVVYREANAPEIDTDFDMKVINIVEAARADWASTQIGTYPGDPYQPKVFPKYYSDHHPIHFRMRIVADDD